MLQRFVNQIFYAKGKLISYYKVVFSSEEVILHVKWHASYKCAINYLNTVEIMSIGIKSLRRYDPYIRPFTCRSLFQIMACRLFGARPLTEPLLWTLGLYSLSGKTSYRQISWSLKTVRLDVIMFVPLWNLTGVSAAPRYLSNFRAIGKV